MNQVDQREQLVQGYRELSAAGLGTGSSGNLSVRAYDGMLITPTGIAPQALEPGQAVAMSLAGDVAEGQLRPSSEWQLHAAIYTARPDVQAVVHCHSRYATILACAHRTIPALHYMIAITGVDEIPLAPYATFGTPALAEAVVTGLGEGGACLLANHGQLAAATDLARALRIAREVEELAAMYWGCLAIGGGNILTDDAMDEVRAAFATYGQQAAQDISDNT
jgi:L-fuculose-phosphate aldolase